MTAGQEQRCRVEAGAWRVAVFVDIQDAVSLLNTGDPGRIPAALAE